jgi:hypothetical protein
VNLSNGLSGVGTILNDDSPLQLSGPAQDQAASATPADPLSSNALEAAASRAVSIWSAVNLPVLSLRELQHVSFQVADLPGNMLGVASPGTITIDVDAAGYGWFTDISTQPTGGHADLLTTVLHELGHELGYDDVYDPSYAGLMAGTLPLDTRRLPDAELASTAATDRLFADLASGVSHWRETDFWLHDDEFVPLFA